MAVMGWLPLEVSAQTTTNTETAATLLILNREVATFRGNLGTYTPEQRVSGAESRILQAVKTPDQGVRAASFNVDNTVEFRVRGHNLFDQLARIQGRQLNLSFGDTTVGKHVFDQRIEPMRRA